MHFSKRSCRVCQTKKLKQVTEGATERLLFKKGVLGYFAKFTAKNLCWSLFFNKVEGLRSTVLLKKRLQHRCFALSFARFQEHLFDRTPLGNCFLSKVEPSQRLFTEQFDSFYLKIKVFICVDNNWKVIQKYLRKVFYKKACSQKFLKVLCRSLFLIKLRASSL